MKINNVTQLKPQEQYLQESIELIMLSYRERSENTYKTYMSNYREFFEIVLNKEISFVSWEDLLSIRYEDILRYRKALQDKGNINKTINLKVASLSTLYEELHKINREVDLVVVSPASLPEDESEGNTYGSLKEQEVESLIDYCYNLPKRQKPKQRAMFFKLAYVTAIRQGALLSMQWDDITPILEDKKAKGMLITVKDKGKTIQTPITLELYNELLEVKQEDNINDGRVFPTTRKTLSKTLKDFCEDDGIDHEKRNIVLHSLKKASIDKVYLETGDITKTARHGHHSGIEMVYKTYEGKNSKLLEQPSFTVFDKSNIKQLEKDLQKYDKGDIIEAIVKLGIKFGEDVLTKLEEGE